jgi:hypothetical protein
VISALLFALAASSAPQAGARVQAVATARILPGARIGLSAAGFGQQRKAVPDRQVSRIRRLDRTIGQSELRLVEFQ